MVFLSLDAKSAACVASSRGTCIEDTAHTSPVDAANFIDHGLAGIGGIGALLDANYPVPPAFA